MREALQKKATETPKRSSALKRPNRTRSPNPVALLQSTIGNQTVQRLINGSGLWVQGSGVRIQAKLTIGPSNDIYEQEADRVADQVMRMPEREGEGRRVKGEERQGGGQWMTDGGLKRDALQLKPG